MFDLYIRVSKLGERSEGEATEVYEAQCRAWADRARVAIDEVVEEMDVSGAAAVAERKLERLLQRVEGGESEGIITPYLDRFGRDLIEGALAYRRLKLAGGRLVCVNDGVDSDRPGDEFQFQIRMVIAEDYLRRTRSNFQAAIDRAAARGVYLASRPPFGYRKDEDRRLVVDEAKGALVVELFERRAAGANVGELSRFLQAEGIEITKSGVRAILANRAYVGEMKLPTGVKGQPKVVKNHHPPILTEQQWEAGQVKHEFVPRNGRTQEAGLRGLVHCASCGKRCKVTLYGRPENRKTNYTCTYEKCTAHAGMKVSKLDAYVDAVLMQAAADHEPHVEAIILGHSRYQDALGVVEQAREAFEEFRDSLELQRELGIDGFAKGLKVRKQALELVRRELATVRPPTASDGNRKHGSKKVSFDEFIAEYERDRYAQFIDKIVLKPAGRVGSRVPPVEKRVDVYFAGADKPAHRASRSQVSHATKHTSSANANASHARDRPKLAPAQRNELSVLDSQTRARNSMPRSGASAVALSRKGKGGDDMKRRYQIRDQDFGLAIYEADFAAEALAAFLADKIRAALDPADYKVNDFGDGTASVLWRGIEYRAYTAVHAT